MLGQRIFSFGCFGSGSLLWRNVLFFISITLAWDALGSHFGTWGRPGDRGSSTKDIGLSSNDLGAIFGLHFESCMGAEG